MLFLIEITYSNKIEITIIAIKTAPRIHLNIIELAILSIFAAKNPGIATKQNSNSITISAITQTDITFLGKRFECCVIPQIAKS
jgi:hypothetical protein